MRQLLQLPLDVNDFVTLIITIAIVVNFALYLLDLHDIKDFPVYGSVGDTLSSCMCLHGKARTGHRFPWKRTSAGINNDINDAD